MGQALYRKYRSKSLAEIGGQEHITRALSRAIDQGKISHAYLFTGPRGVGKTSIARILAHEVNGLPYSDEASHLDIIEIDAASNRRIDEVRDLRDKVHVAPTSAKYKVYIIDEVHMLTREAFNALLKTLEEPPEHVIFILATTEMHKLPETIVSRTQHYAFKPIGKDIVIDHLGAIAKKEKITIEPSALELIALHGEGSFRDSISLFDQVRNYADKITVQDVQAMLGIAPETVVNELIQALGTNNPQTIIKVLLEQREQGIEPSVLAKQLGQALRLQIMDETSALDPQRALVLMGELIKIAASSDPQSALEICLLQQTFQTSSVDSQIKPTQAVTKIVQQEVATAKNDTSKKAAEKEKVSSEVHAAEAAKEIVPAATGITENTWVEVLMHIKQQYNTMYGVLRMAEPVFAGKTLTLTFAFTFHQKRANDPKNKAIIIDAVKAASGVTVKLICEVGNVEKVAAIASAEAAPVASATESASLGAISNIFGGGELLES